MQRQFAMALAILLGLCGCWGNSPAPHPESGPRQPHLVVYTPYREEIYAPILKEFQERTGIWVLVETGDSLALLERIAGEAAAPQCDLLFGGSALAHKTYTRCFEPYFSVEADRVNPVYGGDDSLSTPFSLQPLVLVYNTKIVSPREVPTGWNSLLDTRWQGRVAFADPALSASGYVALTALIQAGPGDPWQTLDRFADNLGPGLIPGSDQIIPAVADGLFPLGVTLEGDAFRRNRGGYDLAVVYPEEGTLVMPDVSSLVKNAPHPGPAKQFIDFTISRDAQQMISVEMGCRPAREDVGPPPWMKPTAEILLLPYNEGWSIGAREQILSRWQPLFPKREVTS